MRSSVADFQERTTDDVESRDADWFFRELEAHCSEVVSKGSDFLIVCPFHLDSNPSCGVDQATGRFNCWSCKAGGGWNKLAHKIGAEKLRVRGRGRDKDVIIDVRDMSEIKDDMTRAFSKSGVIAGSKRREEKTRPIVKEWNTNDSWRSVEGNLLKSLGCVRVIDLTFNVLRIGLPVRDIGGGLIGYTCRALDPEDTDPKYTPLAADRISWRKKELPASEALFLIDLVLGRDWKRIVLVEGPYDAMHLIAHDIPAVAILGTNNWTKQKAAIVRALGLEKVFVCMDNDRSGHEAQDNVVSSLKGYVPVEGIALPKKAKDPGQLSTKQLAWMRRKVLG